MSFSLKIDLVLNKAIGELAKGNPDALSDIYDSMGKQIYFLALSVLKNPHDAEDLLQQVLLEVAKNAHAYRPGSNARAWIQSIARNQALLARRDRKQHACFEETENELIQENADPLSSLIVTEAFQGLSTQERQIVMLHVYSKLRFHEIAKLLDLSHASAQKKYQRALKKLKKYYSEN